MQYNYITSFIYRYLGERWSDAWTCHVGLQNVYLIGGNHRKNREEIGKRIG